jgi:hypothetical protein
MKKLLLIIAFALAMVAVNGCKSSHAGSREFAPGKGWQQN